MESGKLLRTYDRPIETNLSPEELRDVEKKIADKVAELASINAQLKEATAPLKEDRKLVQSEIDELSQARETAKLSRQTRCVDRLFGRRVQTYTEAGGELVDDRAATEDELQERLPGTDDDVQSTEPPANHATPLGAKRGRAKKGSGKK